MVDLKLKGVLEELIFLVQRNGLILMDGIYSELRAKTEMQQLSKEFIGI